MSFSSKYLPPLVLLAPTRSFMAKKDQEVESKFATYTDLRKRLSVDDPKCQALKAEIASARDQRDELKAACEKSAASILAAFQAQGLTLTRAQLDKTP
jgi:cell division septum initiation protein DivIVA